MLRRTLSTGSSRDVPHRSLRSLTSTSLIPLRIWEVTGSSLGPKPNYTIYGLHRSLTPSRQMFGKYLQTDQDRLLPHPSQFDHDHPVTRCYTIPMLRNKALTD
jgi:hypothetical protein